ncbi:MAG TPA: biotin/lipoyl-containing protein, partial [Myxococcota bacterium]|nr:biotin/lipoyl-containing protein [Myxococcota bacterium]
MSVAVELPALGESVVEGTVSRWLVKEGERVELDQPLVEVTTDKVDAEIPAPAAGVVEKILAREGETVAVGQRLALIDPGATARPGAAAAAQPAAVAAAPAAAPRAAAAEPRATPLARRVAEREGIDLAAVEPGSGS